MEKNDLDSATPEQIPSHIGPIMQFTGYAEVASAGKNWREYRNHPAIKDQLPLPPLEIDPPDHRQWRKPFEQWLSKDNINSAKEYAYNLSTDLLKTNCNEFDLAQGYALEIPINTLKYMLGIQESENSIISDWATIARQMDDLDGIKREKAREKYNHHVAILADYLFERMRTGSFPSYSPIHSFIFSIDPSIHLEKHVKKAFELMLIAGHHTTGYAIGNLLARLSEQKSIQKKVAENRELVPICIEESLRLDSPVIEMRRRTFCTSTVSSEVIDEGQEVALCWGQANRDPAYFEAPNSFHLHRRETKHLAFGTGLHKCVGSALARMEMAIALNRLLEVHKSWELSSACLRLEEGNIGVLSIPVTFGVN